MWSLGEHILCKTIYPPQLKCKYKTTCPLQKLQNNISSSIEMKVD